MFNPGPSQPAVVGQSPRAARPTPGVIALSTQKNELRAWTTGDSRELYQLGAWGAGCYSINERGELVVQPKGDAGPGFSLPELVEDLRSRGIELPVLLRISDILQMRVEALAGAFGNAIQECGYRGRYRPVFPIKVNQQRDVVEELVDFGKDHALGLEAGSKPELLIVLAHMTNEDGLVICNGYKDESYIETAMLARKMGLFTIIVIDRFEELETVLAVSKRLDMRPHIGVRAKLASRGAGKWQESGGEKSKFGLTAGEIVAVTERLAEVGMLDCLELLHFHIGSQITAIRAIKDALKEATRIYAEVHDLGAGLRYLDVGGGLAVDYDGSQTNFHSSANYSMQEYANDVVFAIQQACDEKEIPHPDVVSESGRALSAHHAILVFDVLGVSRQTVSVPKGGEESEEATITNLAQILADVSTKNFQESYHDALQLKEEAISLFNLGYLDLKGRALAESLFWAICDKIQGIVKSLDYVPEELHGLGRALADTYYCNFSVFQSAPDHWAVKQLFPTMPIHRLNERPTRHAILADLTCDSDGKVDKFIDLRDVKSTLELHTVRPGTPYYIGMFLVGAYQEILGDLHNLFGDTNAIHVSLDEDYGYSIERVIEGDSVAEVLSYVQYDKQDLMRRMRKRLEGAVRARKVDMRESALLMRRYEQGLSGYTYLADDDLENGDESPGESVAARAAVIDGPPILPEGSAIPPL
ncbi:MAG: biosynthetic arginine decarboxylase [Planctomycetes bacterium]|nr:biosynthetic arginine decarboxylase [Planctomycetota bacterium]